MVAVAANYIAFDHWLVADGNRQLCVSTLYLLVVLMGRWLQKAENVLLDLWIAFGRLLNRIFSPIILGVVYFCVLTPVALLYRLFHRTPKRIDSTFVVRNHTFNTNDFLNPW